MDVQVLERDGQDVGKMQSTQSFDGRVCRPFVTDSRKIGAAIEHDEASNSQEAIIRIRPGRSHHPAATVTTLRWPPALATMVGLSLEGAA